MYDDLIYINNYYLDVINVMYNYQSGGLWANKAYRIKCLSQCVVTWNFTSSRLNKYVFEDLLRLLCFVLSGRKHPDKRLGAVKHV